MAKLVKKKKAEPEFFANVRRMAALATELKAGDIRAYDVRGLTDFTDALILCSAASEPQMRAIHDRLLTGMKEIGVAPFASEGTPGGGWIVIDYSDVVFHLFSEQVREFYDLDGLWGDAPLIDVGVEDRADGKARP